MHEMARTILLNLPDRILDSLVERYSAETHTTGASWSTPGMLAYFQQLCEPYGYPTSRLDRVRKAIAAA